MKNYNQELIKNGAKDKEVEQIIQRNLKIITNIKEVIPYEAYNMLEEMLDNYENLINKYSKYAYLLGFARAMYEKE